MGLPVVFDYKKFYPENIVEKVKEYGREDVPWNP